jgi:glutamate dehydrogenase
MANFIKFEIFGFFSLLSQKNPNFYYFPPNSPFPLPATPLSHYSTPKFQQVSGGLNADAIKMAKAEIIEKLHKEPLSPCFDFLQNDDVTLALFATSTYALTAVNTVNQLQYITRIANDLELTIIEEERTICERVTGCGQIIILFSFTLSAPTSNQIHSFQQKLFNLVTLPYSNNLTPAFLAGTLNFDDYLYVSLVTRILFYSVSHKSASYTSLIEHFTESGDSMNLAKLRGLVSMLRREAITIDRLETTFLSHLTITQSLRADFISRQSSPAQDIVDGCVGEVNNELLNAINKTVSTVINPINKEIFTLSHSLNRAISKSNIYTLHAKQALAIRINGDFFSCMDLPRLPFAVFFVLGPVFQGFHVRFADVSRGGIRLIISRDETMYNKSRLTQFDETFNLAFTQNLKNKDIPEFGSKGTVLLNPNVPVSQGIPSFERYINSLLDLLIPQDDLPTPTFVDNYSKSELLFLGPDEGTAGVMKWAALRAKERGYSYWRAFTTGKPAVLGGIPHDVYAMTTNSVHRYVLGALRKLGLNEEDVFKCQTAGPDGDLGSNEIKISKDKTIAIVDGSGVLFDPKGIDRDELTQLALKRVMSKEFPLDKLSPEGFFVSVDDKNVTLPDGEVVSNGFDFRNDFHLNERFTSDLFVPCGGRPEAVNLTNVSRLFKSDGVTPKFKIIIEGANLFISQEARLVLEKAGVILYKDASTNKGGVTSSSLEVLAALALPTDVFETSMAVHDRSNPPASYDKYAREIQARIIRDADLEFECIWDEHERTGLPRYVLTDKISNRINEFNDEIHHGDLFDDMVVRANVLKELLPKTLQDMVGYDVLIKTAPESYLKASFTAYLASKFIYKKGLDATNEDFKAYIDELYRK